jgi:hypothetical protein
MGYSFMGQVISLDDLRQLYGSRDEAVYARLTAPRADYVGFLMGKKGDGQEAEVMASALRSILQGEDCTALPPHTYGYAVVAWCHEFGEKAFSIDTRHVADTRSLLSAYGLRLDLDLWSALDARWPIPIPETPRYPLVGWFDRATCEKHAQDLAAIYAELGQHDYFTPLRDGFARAVATGRDVIVFNY